MLIKNFLIFILVGLIKIYSYFISPLLGIKCRFLPTCSEYCQESLGKHGLIKGGFYSLKRITKCHPVKILGASDGIDLVPEKKIKSRELN
ncbi:membrane protein insertion efficiency factor YidD [Pelagibacteraceae bacterium]|nr:membrane protein insertion efficiency factor YidD [Pelagibacteraceae bacterium]